MRKRGNKRLRKKGLSAVVTTLVIILLVLVSIGIIWVVIKNLIVGGVEEISLGKFSTELNIKSVKVEGDVLSVGVERAVGKGNLVKLKFIFENGTDSEIIERETDIEELDEKSFIFGLGDLSLLGIKKVSIVPIYKSSSGKEVSGDIIDIFELKKPIREEAGTWEYIGNFARYGPVGIGRMEYSISSGENKLPEFSNIIVDPLDVHLGDTQTFIVYVTSPYEITEVITRTQLDNELLILPLEKTENEDEYMASWTVYDTHVTDYHTTFIAKDSAGNENNITLTWTDPCTDINNHGTTFNLDSNCQVSSGVDGVDVGNIIIDSGFTLTMTGGTFIKTPGYTMTNYGTVAFGGGVLQTGYLYYNDADGDLYGSGYNWSSSSTYAGHTRANSALGGSDCLDSDADVYRNVGNMILDGDQDRYSTGSGATRCVGAKSSYWYKDADATYKWISTSDDLGTSDCNDGNNAIWVNKYEDNDHDGYCNSAAATCSNGAHPFDKDSCTGYSDCSTADADIYWSQNVGQDVDLDRYYTGTMAFRCVGVASGYWFRNAAGVNNWLASAPALGGSDCDDTLSDRYITRTCYLDSDGDGYTVASGTSRCKAASCAAPADSYKALSNPTDCQDSGAGAVNVYRNVGSLGLDVDHDRYTTGSSTTRCVGAKSSVWYRDTTGVYKYITTTDDYGTGTDCLDSASSVNPGVTAWFTTAGPNNWDYNCVSGGQKRYTDATSYCGDTIWMTNSGCDGDWDQGMGACGCDGTNQGWVSSAAACGVTAGYVNSNSCPDFGPGCPSSKTQQCH